MRSPFPRELTKSEFESVLSRYPDTISRLSSTRSSTSDDDTLTALETWRTTSLPSLLASRSPPHMTKDELLKLLQCKLKRGKSRPFLPSQVASNPDSMIIETTKSAFGGKELSQEEVIAAIKKISELKGVGPATASYVLAAWSPKSVPVFSDEAFRWCHYIGKGWDKKINYNIGEYARFLAVMGEVRDRLGVTSEEVEKVGYVLGKEGAESEIEKAIEKSNKTKVAEQKRKRDGEAKKDGGTKKTKKGGDNGDSEEDAKEEGNKEKEKKKAPAQKPKKTNTATSKNKVVPETTRVLRKRT